MPSVISILLAIFTAYQSRLNFIAPKETVFTGMTRFALETDVASEDIIGLELFVNGVSVAYLDGLPLEKELDMKRFPGGAIRIRAELAVFGADKLVSEMEGVNYPDFEEVEVNLVRIPVMIQQERVERLFAKEDFTLFEEGKPVEVAFVFDEEKPLHLVVLLDSSGSMDRHIPMLRRGVFSLIDTLRPGDSIHVIGFDHQIFEISPPETDMEKVKQRLYSVESGGSTNLYGALWSGIKSAEKSDQRRALILFTDGYHELDGMKDLYGKTEEDCINLARERGVPIYALGLGLGVSTEVLNVITGETGGKSFFFKNMKAVQRAFSEIGKELRRHYLLCYYTQSAKLGWHGLEIKHKDGLTLRYPQRVYLGKSSLNRE